LQNTRDGGIQEILTVKKLLHPLPMAAFGLILGIISRLSDIYTDNLGNILSQMAIWILLGTLISIYSPTKKRAMMNIFPFCMGMLVTYYITAALFDGVYSRVFIVGWTLFALFSPIMAFFAWMTKEKGIFPKIISVGIVLFSVLSSIILFDRIRIYDIVIDAVLVYFLFAAKIER